MEEDHFKIAVGRFQTEGDRSVIEEVLRHWRQGSAPNARDQATFVADTMVKTTAPEIEALGYEHSALPEFRAAIMDGLGIDIYAEPDLMAAVKNAGAIRTFLGVTAFEEFSCAIESFLDFLPYHNSVIVPALEHALRRADLFRGERAVVAFIKRSFFTEYTRLLTEYNGTKRLGRRDESGNFYNVFVDPRPPHVWSIVFDRRVNDSGVPALLDRLTKTQRGYAEMAHEIITGDIERGVMDEYRVDESGNYRIKFRYMAGRLGVEESSLRKTFGKIRSRAAKNVPILAY